MRDIKFRVWSTQHKEFWCLLLGHEFTFKDTDVIMQYTGLTDKNGKEIYEGDIVRPIQINGTITDAVIKYNFDSFRVEQIGAEKMQEYLAKYNNKIEIIGNIYENKNLLD